jgi:hypothetical protein
MKDHALGGRDDLGDVSTMRGDKNDVNTTRALFQIGKLTEPKAKEGHERWWDQIFDLSKFRAFGNDLELEPELALR